MSVIRQIVDCIHEDTALKGVEFCVGRLSQKESHSPPFVSWTPTSCAWEAPEDIGLRITNTTEGRVQILTRLQTFEISVRGHDIAHTEDMIDAVAGSIARGLRGSYVLGTATWTTQSNEGAEYAQDGERVLMELTIAIPVFNEEHDLTVLTGESMTANFVSELDGSVEQIHP